MDSARANPAAAHVQDRPPKSTKRSDLHRWTRADGHGPPGGTCKALYSGSIPLAASSKSAVQKGCCPPGGAPSPLPGHTRPHNPQYLGDGERRRGWLGPAGAFITTGPHWPPERFSDAQRMGRARQRSSHGLDARSVGAIYGSAAVSHGSGGARCLPAGGNDRPRANAMWSSEIDGRACGHCGRHPPRRGRDPSVGRSGALVRRRGDAGTDQDRPAATADHCELPSRSSHHGPDDRVTHYHRPDHGVPRSECLSDRRRVCYCCAACDGGRDDDARSPCSASFGGADDGPPNGDGSHDDNRADDGSDNDSPTDDGSDDNDRPEQHDDNPRPP